MLGFGKKKKKDKADAKNDPAKAKKEKKGKNKSDNQDASNEKKPGNRKKKRLSKKLVFTLLLVFIVAGASSYIVYTMYFKAKDPGAKSAKYVKIALAHSSLPEEILKFSFDYFPDLYIAIVSFNKEIDLLDKEIARIEGIAQRYPDQKKIADKEKKSWEKIKSGLQKAFLKIEKPVKETYVLFRVNKEQGLVQIESKKSELTELARTSLVPAQEMTQKLKQDGQVPKGLIKGNLYKLKKKFL